MPENSEGSNIEPRSSVSPFIDLQIEKTVSLENKRSMHKLSGVRGKLAALGLGIVTGFGGSQVISDDSPREAHAFDQDSKPAVTDTIRDDFQIEPTAAPVREPALHSERVRYEEEIEEKYGIKLLNQREGYERIGKNYNEEDEETMGHRPVVRWPKEQLMTADEVLSYFPKSFLTAEGGKKFALSLWDYGSKEEYAGMYHNSFNMISVNENSFTKLGGTAQLLAHELGHKNDSEELKNKLHEIVDIDKSFLNKKYFHVDGRFYYRNPDIAQVVATFRNMMYEGDGETRANFFQTYIKGYERFMNAVGPVIDGGKFRTDIPRDKLALKFPRAQEIYELYLNVFEGKEFDALQIKLDPDFKYINT